MNISKSPLQFLLLFSFINFSRIATCVYIPRLSPIGPRFLQDLEVALASVSEDYETFYYNQTIDHFNYRPESYATFKQKCYINYNFWGGNESAAPILVYLGAEAPLEGVPNYIGFLADNAPRFKALLLYIEHRFYGESIPFGTREEALKNATTRGYFNSAQAIADYAEIILHFKKTLYAEKSPVIVIGGSYGGMLASWFRLKFPHIAIGALASSAPVLYFNMKIPENGYYYIVSKNFKEASETCYETITRSWAEIDEVAKGPHGLSILSEKFQTCDPLYSSSTLKNYLVGIYITAAQNSFPAVIRICKGIDGVASEDILSKIFAGVVAYYGKKPCYVNSPSNIVSETSLAWRWQIVSEIPSSGWTWQTCSEVVIPLGRGNETMFPPAPFNITSRMEWCKSVYGVSTRPRWIPTHYGGLNIKLALKKFGSNIIYSNGLRDPWSGGGVLEDISDSIVAIKTREGTHCTDITTVSEPPEWLINQREEEIKIMQQWVAQYYSDLGVNSELRSEI